MLTGGPEDVRGMRVLVVGINYAPEHTGIAPYTTRACEYFAAQGAEVLVLAGVPHYPHWSVPEPYRRRLRVTEQHGAVTVHRLRHHVPAEQSALKRGAYEGTFALNVLAQRLPWRPDVVLAVVPGLLGTVSARLIARRSGARFIVWVQDLMGPAAAQSGIAGGGRVAALTGAAEGWVLRRADQVVVLNDAFRRYTGKLGVRPEAVVIQPNWTHITAPSADRRATRARLGWRQDETVVLHSGNMGLKQGLEHVVEAARYAEAQRAPVRFVLMGDGSQRADLQRRGAGVRALDFLPPVGGEEFPDVLAAADILLVNERASAFDMSLPSKLTSYFRAGRPVVAAVHPDGGTASEVRRSQAGVIAAPEDPAALLSAVLAIGTNAAEHARMQGAATQYADLQLDAYRALGALTATLTPLPRSSVETPLVIDLTDQRVESSITEV